jgi:pimeloyl-ACP methyl ester carboxylesterase
MKDLVCLHAAASSPATWAHLKPALTDHGYRVHTPTLLGHHGGERRAAYPLDAFADHLLKQLEDLDRMTLVGASLGAFVATLIAQRDPARIDRLVLEELPIPRRTKQDKSPSNQRGTALVLQAMGPPYPHKGSGPLARSGSGFPQLAPTGQLLDHASGAEWSRKPLPWARSDATSRATAPVTGSATSGGPG